MELSFSINSDEAAALGGSYQAAHVTKLFRVKTIWVRDGALEPIEVRFEREVDPDENDGLSVKEVKRTLFQVMNPYPQKKAITFNRFQDDFNFSLVIGKELHHKTTLKGVKEAMEEYADAEAKGVKAHFRMDDSGIIRLESAEATFQKEVMPEPTTEEKKKTDAPDIDKGTLDNLKEKFADFFNGENSSEEDAKKVLEELQKGMKKDKDTETDKEPEESEESNDDTTTGNEKTESEGSEKEAEEQANESEKSAEDKEDGKQEETNEGDAKEEKAEDTKEEEKKEAEPPKPVLKTFSKSLEFDQENHHVKVIDDETKKAIYDQLKALDEVEAAQRLLVESQNDLESFIYDKQDKLHLEGYTEYLSDEKRDELSAVFSEASDWLWDVEDPTAITYQDKLAELKKATKDWSKRVEESQKRPEVIDNLKKLFTATKTIIYDDFKNKTGEGLALSQDDIHAISEKLEKTEDWLAEELEKQDDLPLYETPSLKSSDVEVKGRVLSKAVDDLIKKVRLWRPPKPTETPKPEKTETKEEEEKTEANNEEESEDKEDESTDNENKEDSQEPDPVEDTEKASEPETTEEPEVTHDAGEL